MGAIAGGVVGGVVLLAALGLVIFFLRKRRREAVGNTATGAPPPVTPYDPPSMAQTPYAPPPMAGGYAPGPAFSPTSEQQRLYVRGTPYDRAHRMTDQGVVLCRTRTTQRHSRSRQ